MVDTSVLVHAERTGTAVEDLVASLSHYRNSDQIAISVVTVAELTHGIYRAPSAERSAKRRRFVDDVIHGFVIHPLTLEIATLTGRIEGEQAAQGIAIAFQDLVIGSTALHLDHSVLTANPRHFALIPGLTIHTF